VNEWIVLIYVSGDNFMSPGILAHLWVEEENKRKELEKKLRETLQTNQVQSCRIANECDWLVCSVLCRWFGVRIMFVAVVKWPCFWLDISHPSCNFDIILLFCRSIKYRMVNTDAWLQSCLPQSYATCSLLPAPLKFRLTFDVVQKVWAVKGSNSFISHRRFLVDRPNLLWSNFRRIG